MVNLPGSPCLGNGSRCLLVSASGSPQLGFVQRASNPSRCPLSRRGWLVNRWSIWGLPGSIASTTFTYTPHSEKGSNKGQFRNVISYYASLTTEPQVCPPWSFHAYARTPSNYNHRHERRAAYTMITYRNVESAISLVKPSSNKSNQNWPLLSFVPRPHLQKRKRVWWQLSVIS